MAARSISTGSLSFGLVNVPIKMYSTSVSRSDGGDGGAVRFHWLHESCGTRVKQQYYCPKHEKAVGRDELVRGYETSKGKYVKVSAEELEATKIDKRESIDILSFVPVDAVEVLFLEHAYYLAPDKGGAKGYAVLTEAMKRSGLVAIGKYAARGTEHVVSIRADGHVLLMHQLRYADEVRSPDEIPVDKQKVSDKELSLAEKLIEQTTEKTFDAASFEDEAKSRKKALIARKSAAGDVATDEEAARGGDGHGRGGGKVIDLMDALKASLAGGTNAGGGGSKTATKAPARPKRASRSSAAARTRRSQPHA
jgi:DNA end-binding protein Ku